MWATSGRNVRLSGVTKMGAGRGAFLPSRKQRKTKFVFAPFLLHPLLLLQAHKVYNLDQTTVAMVTDRVSNTVVSGYM